MGVVAGFGVGGQVQLLGGERGHRDQGVGASLAQCAQVRHDQLGLPGLPGLVGLVGLLGLVGGRLRCGRGWGGAG